MRTSQDDYDVRIGFSFLDSQYRQQIDPITLLTYIYLRRYVWRGKSGANKIVQALLSEGCLVARIGQAKLSEQVGVSSRTIRTSIRKLEKMGWVETREFSGDGLYYVLGKQVAIKKDKLKTKGEIFFADAITEEVIEIERKNKEKERKKKTLDSYRSVPGGADQKGRGGRIKMVRVSGTKQHIEVENNKVENNKIDNDRNAPACAERRSDIRSADLLSKTDRQAGQKKKKQKNLEITPSDQPVGNDDEVPEEILRRERAAEVVQEAGKKTKAALEKRLAKKKTKLPKAKTIDFENLPKGATWEDVRDWFRIAVRKKFGQVAVGRWKGHETQLAKDLLVDYGDELVEQAIAYVVQHWEELSVRLKLKSAVPSIGMLWGYRDTIFGEVQVGKPIRYARKGTFEYNKESAGESPSAGWGDLTEKLGD